MIKKFFSALVVVLFATSMMAQTGLTCDDPIHVDKNYKGHVEVNPEVGYTELWYTASTYDLPLHVYFSPDSAGSVWSPEVYVDFTCEPGVYDDSKLDSLINKMFVFGIQLPLEFMCDGVFRNGQQEWDLSINKSYREQLTEAGITYDIQAYVRVVFYESGSISLTPDTTYTSCMDNEYVTLGDTIEILPNDSDRIFVMPYTDWQNDSVRFVWEGEQEANVWLAVEKCDFTPNTTSSFVWDVYTLSEGMPHKLQQQEIVDIIKAHKNGGVYFGKVLSPVAGKLIVEKTPMAPIEGGATLLEYGQSVEVNSADQLFCFSRTWGATEFISSVGRGMTMYMAATPDFEASTGDANVIAYHDFTAISGQGYNYISKTEMTKLLENVPGDYVYVRFQCAQPATLIANVWDASSCANKSLMIRPNQKFSVPANSKSTVYRMLYADWKHSEVTIKWSGNSTLPTYIADTCSFVLSSSSPNVLLYKNIERKGTAVIDEATIDSWESHVDIDGYLYVCFNPTNKGNVTFEVVLSEVPEDVYTTITAAICFGESYDWNGQTYNETGKYTQTFPAANGADSIVTLNLTVLPEVPVTKEIAAVCYGETYTWQGQEYTESGEYSVTLQDVNGCDSVITLAFTVYPQTPDTTDEVTIKFGESYEWNGQTYSTAGEYPITLQDANGCDYQATLVLTVLPEEKPEEDGTILLNPTDELVLNLDSAVNVYRTDYDVWSASKVQLDWYGDKPLHVFVSKDKDFFVAIYHEDVVLYQKIDAVDSSSVEPQVLVLDMSALRAYVNDGKLYVRFLTDSDARLVIEPLTE